MPRAFLIKAKTRVPTQKKDKPFPGDENTDTNAQSREFSSKQDSPVGRLVIATSPPAAQITQHKDTDRKYDPSERYVYNSRETNVTEEVTKNNSPRVASAPQALRFRFDNSRDEYRKKRVYQDATEFIDERQHEHKKLRQGQPKRSAEAHYNRAEDGGSEREIKKENANIVRANAESRRVGFGPPQHYTHEVRHYANEGVNYGQKNQATQSRETSNGGGCYSRATVDSFAMQNGRGAVERGKTNFSRRIDTNNNLIEKNEGLENVKIVECHSISKPRPYHSRPSQGQQGYYTQPRDNVGRTMHQNAPSPVVTTEPFPQATHQSQPPKQEPDPKIVYVPVYPVAQGPNGVIYEPIPNATPIMAKDAVKIEHNQPSPQLSPRLQPSPPQLSPTGVPSHRSQQPLPSPIPPMQHPGQSGRPMRGYEPPQQQQLAAAPAPQPYPAPPQHSQSQVVVQQQPPYPPQSAAGMPLPTYHVNRPQMQYRPRAQSHPPPPQSPHQPPMQQSYPPQRPPVSIARVPVSTVQHYPGARPQAPTSQAYQVVPQPYNGQYEQQHHPAVSRQRYQGPGNPPVTVTAHGQPSYQPAQPQQIRYQHPEGRYGALQSMPNHQRPPPLPSQPRHAEKPALPSPSYPQESASRLPTPQYTPNSAGQEQKFVYAPPPANFMNSPVYRVPTQEEAEKRDMQFHANVNNHKTGSRKRKSSTPAHALPLAQRHVTSVPSPPDSYTEQASPVEADLRCNERLIRSPHQASTLNHSSLVMTPPGSPNDENGEMVTVVVRDQGIQASPHDAGHPHMHPYGRNHSLHSESSDEEDDLEIDEEDEDEDGNSWPSSPTEKENMYTEDGTLVVHIPHPSQHRKFKGRRGNVRFTCRYCHKGFQWHSHLASHERTHTGEKPFKCPECNRAFCRADGLQCHMLVHNKKKLFKCHYCGKGFNDKIILEKHIYSHTGVKPFKCEYCGRAFSDSLSIEKHLLVHTGTKPYKCQYCVRSFNDSQMLVRHIRSHTGEKPFKCKHCPMAFSKQSALIIHTRVHTGEKPYQCPNCTKSFSISGNLQRHILIHTGERPYKCSKCPKAFNNPSHLSRHISKLHAPQPLSNSKMEQNSYQAVQESIPEMYPQVAN